jgi:hypothetical protein
MLSPERVLSDDTTDTPQVSNIDPAKSPKRKTPTSMLPEHRRNALYSKYFLTPAGQSRASASSLGDLISRKAIKWGRVYCV